MKKYEPIEIIFNESWDVILTSTLDDDPFVQDAYSGLKGIGGGNS